MVGGALQQKTTNFGHVHFSFVSCSLLCKESWLSSPVAVGTLRSTLFQSTAKARLTRL